MKKVGAVTIGQSPRPDVVGPMRSAWGEGVMVAQRGALDGLSPAQISRLRPGADEETLVTRLRDGVQVKVARRRVGRLMQQRVDELVDDGCHIVVVLCTGYFDLSGGVFVVYPRDALIGVVRATAVPDDDFRLGVLVPDCSQNKDIGRLWARQGYEDPVVCAHSPYQFDNRQNLEKVLCVYRESDVNLAVLDCMGYTPSHARVLQRQLRVPVVCASAAAAQFTAFLLAMKGNAEETAN